MKNKRARIVGKQKFVIETVDVPKTNGAAIVKIIQTGICGSDVHFWNFGDDLGKDVVLGHEFIGEVVDPGANEELKPGDRVIGLPRNGETGHDEPCGQCEACLAGKFDECSSRVVKYAMGSEASAPGTYAQYLTWYPHSLYKVPDNVDNESVMLVEPFTTSLHAVDMVDMKPGAKVLILGGGTIACGVAEYCKIYGAAEIYMTELNQEKADIIRSWNLVDEVFDAGASDVFEQIAKVAPEGGFDYVFDTVVRSEVLNPALHLLKRFGTCVLVGMNFNKEIPVDVFDLVVWQKRLQGCKGITVGEFKSSLQHIADGHIDAKKYVSCHKKLDDVQEIFEQMKTDKTSFKVVLDVE